MNAQRMGFEESSEGDLSLYEHTEHKNQKHFASTLQHPIPEWRPVYHTRTESEVTQTVDEFESLDSFFPIHRNTSAVNTHENNSEMQPTYVDQSYIKNMRIYINAGRERKYTATSAASSSSVSETYASESQLTSPSTSNSTETFGFTDTVPTTHQQFSCQ